jgi:hypothetical protein
VKFSSFLLTGSNAKSRGMLQINVLLEYVKKSVSLLKLVLYKYVILGVNLGKIRCDYLLTISGGKIIVSFSAVCTSID